MNRSVPPGAVGAFAILACALAGLVVRAQPPSENLPPSAALSLSPVTTNPPATPEEQRWNWHAQNTDIVQGALDSSSRPADIVATRDYPLKYGFGLNAEQEVAANVGLFSRLGWSDGRTEGWVFSDVDRTATAGLSIKGAAWLRPNDTLGLAGVLNGISRVHREFLEDGGTGILAGDGRLSYAWERILETYYDAQLWKSVRLALDYQFVCNPAFNRDRGPVSILGARLHWEY